ncbi:transcriptional regulator with XRE-family HTH domain [Nocardia sp. GAS34]|uniref:helix-turn-helix domain-containing protein n=1 Tax=unclassified Nocardia TaxID=2637762 RepID=UPI003D2395C0
MSTDPRQARAALGARLRELRVGARLSGLDLADRCGWHSSKVSRLESGDRGPSEGDLYAWCEHTGRLDLLDDLIATVRNVRAAYLEWQRVVAAGHAHRQHQSLDLEARTRHIRWYSPDVIPGLLQTEDYARAVLTACIEITAGRDDLDAAVSARMARQHVLRHGARRIHMLIGEPALYRTAGNDETMVGQLQRLLDELDNPRLLIGIIPLWAHYRCPTTSNFVIYDRELVLTETISAELTITRPSEIALHERTFGLLAEQAATGPAAAELITAAARRRRDRTC